MAQLQSARHGRGALEPRVVVHEKHEKSRSETLYRVASVSNAVGVVIGLIGVIDVRAVVTHVPDLIAVRIGLVCVGNGWAVVVLIVGSVAVRIAGVTHVPGSIAVRIGLPESTRPREPARTRDTKRGHRTSGLLRPRAPHACLIMRCCAIACPVAVE